MLIKKILHWLNIDDRQILKKKRYTLMQQNHKADGYITHNATWQFSLSTVSLHNAWKHSRLVLFPTRVVQWSGGCSQSATRADRRASKRQHSDEHDIQNQDNYYILYKNCDLVIRFLFWSLKLTILFTYLHVFLCIISLNANGKNRHRHVNRST